LTAIATSTLQKTGTFAISRVVFSFSH